MPAEELASERALRAQGPVHNIEVGVVLPTGQTVWTNVSAAPVALPDGPVVVVVDDITPRKQAEEARRRREREFSTLVENAPDMIVRFDTDLRYIYCNAAVERQLGVPAHTFLGKTSLEIASWSEMQADLITRSLRRVLETGAEHEVEQSYPTPFAPRHFHTRIARARRAGPDRIPARRHTRYHRA